MAVLLLGSLGAFLSFIIAGGWPLIFKICYAPDAVLTRILLCQMVWYTLIVANM